MKSLFALGALGLVALTSACTVHGYAGAAPAEPVGTTYVTSAPADYNNYPQANYQGHTVYYVNNQWGYPEQGGRWNAYHNEPPELVHYRQNVRQAPPAHPEEQRREEVRPEDRHEEAPPAERVR